MRPAGESMSRLRADKDSGKTGDGGDTGVMLPCYRQFVENVMNLIGYLFVSAVKIQSVGQSSEGKANKHFDGQFRGRCQSKSKHQKPTGQQPCADVGKP